jgi:Protein of unknown function (DUF669)
MPENYETALPEVFDPETQEGTHFDVLSVGPYVAQVVDASVAQPKSGDGYYIGLSWQVTEGEYEGRYVFQRITFLHSNTQAVDIGRRQFKDLCVATGVSEQVKDVEVFKYIPCKLKVGIEKDKSGVYPDKNRVSRILPLKDPKTGKAEPKAATAASAKPEQKTVAPAKPEPQPAPANAAKGNGPMPPPWRKPTSPTGNDIDDEIPY